MITSTSRGRPWLAMAVLAVLSLGVTVFVAQRALGDASDVVIRGEGDVLMSAVLGDLAEASQPPTTADLEKALATETPAGLRYLALVHRDGSPMVEAGVATMSGTPRPGTSEVLGPRVRVANVVFGGRHFPFREHDHERRERDHADRPPPPPGAAPPAPPDAAPFLVLELQPPVIETLRNDLTRISIVATAAGVILLAFALAWSRSAGRLEEAERKARRDERLVALGGMSSVMAHELRNPLASLKGHAQLLAEDLADPKQHAKAERVIHEAERLEVLTTSLLDFVRDGPIEREAVTPAELVARALDHVAAADRVQVDLSAAPDHLYVDQERLARAVRNLVDNALQTLADVDGDAANEPVRLSISTNEGDAVIEVSDRGPGITAGLESKIFEPFHTTRTRGTGLGLPVARRIAEQHGGKLTGVNRAGGGALFRLRFPLGKGEIS